LSAAALGLPGLFPQAMAGQVIEQPEFNLQYGRYQESNDRVAANIYQGSVLAPLAQTGQFQGNWVVDAWSGATPVLTMPAAAAEIIAGASGIHDVKAAHIASENEAPVQVMTGASPGETRYGLELGGDYFLDDMTLHGSVSRSEEPDYLAHSYHIGMDWALNQKLTTLSFGFGQDIARIEPTTRPLSRHRNDYRLQMGLSQVIDKKSLFRMTLAYSNSQGFLSNPYKKVYVQGLPADTGLINAGFAKVFYENRPEHRQQGSLSLGYIHYLQGLDAALHLDYRFYRDSWNINSHTFEAALYQPIGNGWMLVPRIRYYTQSKAGFYQVFFNAPRQDNYYSSDYRLAGFGTLSGGLKLTRERVFEHALLTAAKFALGFEYTQHAADLQLGGAQGSDITDFSYFILTASLKLQF